MEQALYHVGIRVWFIRSLKFGVRGGSVSREGRFRGVKGGSNRWVLGLVSRESCGGVEGCGESQGRVRKGGGGFRGSDRGQSFRFCFGSFIHVCAVPSSLLDVLR